MSAPDTAPGAVRIVGASWRFILANPRATLRTGWLPLAALVWLSSTVAGADPDDILGGLAKGAAVMALLILALVAWQRILFYGADQRPGLSPLRLGRAELLSLLHFPLVSVLFMPLQLWPLVAWLYAAPLPFGGGIAAWMPWIAFAVIVFPGGPFLTRATLMLAAIAAAGSGRMSLAHTANHVWSASAGSTVRIYLTVTLAGLPIAFAAQGLDALDRSGWSVGPQAAAGTLRAVLLLLYVLVVGGALAHAWRTIGGMDNGGGAGQSAAR